MAVLAGCSTGASRPASVAERAATEAIGTTVGDAESRSSRAATAPMAPPVEVPERAMAAYSRALAAMNAEDWIGAELGFKDLLLEYPSFPGPYVNLSILYRRGGWDDEAVAALKRALEIAPDHSVANSELGVIYRERGEFAEAEAAYRRAIEADPSYALAHYNLGVLYDLYLKREAEALEHYEAYLALSFEPDAEVQRWVIDLRRRLGVPAEPAQVAQEAGP